MIGLVSCLTSLVAATASGAVPPEPLTLALSYVVDPKLDACPSEVEFRGSIVEQIGYDPFREAAPQRVVAELRESEVGLSGSVVWTDNSGKQEGDRQFASPSRDCAELAKAVSFSIAVQIQLLNGATKASDRAPTPPPVAAPPVPPRPTVSVVRRPPAPERYLSLGLGPIAELGAAPDTQAGARFFVAARDGALSLELGAFGTLQTKRSEPDGSAFSTRTLGLTLSPCANGQNFLLCAVGRFDRLRVQGFGVDAARAPAALTAQVGLRLGFQQLLSERWRAGAHADGLGLLTPRSVYLNAVPVWSMPNFALSLGIDVSFIFK